MPKPTPTLALPRTSGQVPPKSGEGILTKISVNRRKSADSHLFSELIPPSHQERGKGDGRNDLVRRLHPEKIKIGIHLVFLLLSNHPLLLLYNDRLLQYFQLLSIVV